MSFCASFILFMCIHSSRAIVHTTIMKKKMFAPRLSADSVLVRRPLFFRSPPKRECCLFPFQPTHDDFISLIFSRLSFSPSFGDEEHVASHYTSARRTVGASTVKWHNSFFFFSVWLQYHFHLIIMWSSIFTCAYTASPAYKAQRKTWEWMGPTREWKIIYTFSLDVFLYFAFNQKKENSFIRVFSVIFLALHRLDYFSWKFPYAAHRSLTHSGPLHTHTHTSIERSFPWTSWCFRLRVFASRSAIVLHSAENSIIFLALQPISKHPQKTSRESEDGFSSNQKKRFWLERKWWLNGMEQKNTTLPSSTL